MALYLSRQNVFPVHTHCQLFPLPGTRTTVWLTASFRGSGPSPAPHLELVKLLFPKAISFSLLGSHSLQSGTHHGPRQMVIPPLRNHPRSERKQVLKITISFFCLSPLPLLTLFTERVLVASASALPNLLPEDPQRTKPAIHFVSGLLSLLIRQLPPSWWLCPSTESLASHLGQASLPKGPRRH